MPEGLDIDLDEIAEPRARELTRELIRLVTETLASCWIHEGRHYKKIVAWVRSMFIMSRPS